MGHHDLRALRVHQTATQLLETQRIRSPPSWYSVVSDVPPAQALVRPQPVMQWQSNWQMRMKEQNLKKGRKPSRMFQPQHIKFYEDHLRYDFFSDHPWELARPRIILENDGRDRERHDWSHIQQKGKALDGESVVQRQIWLMENEGMTRYQAYDKARKEFYDIRHREEVERRVAREEALAVGAYFGPSANEVGMALEDQVYDQWRQWAKDNAAKIKQAQAAAYTGLDKEESTLSIDEDATQSGLDELEPSVPGSRKGQEALGGVAAHP